MTTDWLYNNRRVLKLQVRYGNGISHTCIIAQDYTGMYSYFTLPIFHIIIPLMSFVKWHARSGGPFSAFRSAG